MILRYRSNLSVIHTCEFKCVFHLCINAIASQLNKLFPHPDLRFTQNSPGTLYLIALHGFIVYYSDRSINGGKIIEKQRSSVDPSLLTIFFCSKAKFD